MPTDLSHTTMDTTRAYQALHTLDGNYGILGVSWCGHAKNYYYGVGLNINSGRCGCSHDRRVRCRYRSDGLILWIFDSVHICLSQHFIADQIWEVVWAVGSTVGDEDMMAFDTAFIIVEELTFRVEEFWTLFVRGGQDWRKQSGLWQGIRDAMGCFNSSICMSLWRYIHTPHTLHVEDHCDTSPCWATSGSPWWGLLSLQILSLTASLPCSLRAGGEVCPQGDERECHTGESSLIAIIPEGAVALSHGKYCMMHVLPILL